MPLAILSLHPRVRQQASLRDERRKEADDAHVPIPVILFVPQTRAGKPASTRGSPSSHHYAATTRTTGEAVPLFLVGSRDGGRITPCRLSSGCPAPRRGGMVCPGTSPRLWPLGCPRTGGDLPPTSRATGRGCVLRKGGREGGRTDHQTDRPTGHATSTAN